MGDSILFEEDLIKQRDVKSRVEEIASQIRKVLEDANLYKPQLEYMIETTARDLLVYRKLSDAAILAEPYIVVKSRENHPRQLINPIFSQVESASKRLSLDIEKLCCNVKDDKTKSAEDVDMPLGLQEFLS